MNNLRTIKKDVIFLVNEVISDCWVYSYFSDNKNSDKVNEIITEAIGLGDKTFEDINSYPRGKGEAKKYFKVLKKEFNENIEKLFDKVKNL